MCEYGFAESVDFYSNLSKTHGGGGRPATYHSNGKGIVYDSKNGKRENGTSIFSFYRKSMEYTRNGYV